MPFVDFSATGQDDQGMSDSTDIQGNAVTDGQDQNLQNDSTVVQGSTASPQGIDPNLDGISSTKQSMLHSDPASSSAQNFLVGGSQSQEDGVVNPVVDIDDNIKVTRGPSMPRSEAPMPHIINNVVKEPKNNEVPKQILSNVIGSGSLPPLDDILSGKNGTENDSVDLKHEVINNNKQFPTLSAKSEIPSIDGVTQVISQGHKTHSVDNRKTFNIDSFGVETADMNDFMSYAIAYNASDLHISADNPYMVRVDGQLKILPGKIPNNQRIEVLIKEILSKKEFKTLQDKKELDISYSHNSGNRFRINLFVAQGQWGAALRLISSKIKTIAELDLPDIIYKFTKLPHGLVIIAGPTGSGKSTSLAAMLQEININRAEHIVTIEDPVEYVYPKARSRIDQRELGKDTLSWKAALRGVLRQDPNVVLVGEMRDYETIGATVTIAETGHLVFTTLHTNSAAQTVDRIIDVFPEGQQSQIRAQLANVLSAVVLQRLIPVLSGGRRAVHEILIGTTAVKNAIREGKTYQIDNIIQTSSEKGMQTLESSLARMVRDGLITVETAERNTLRIDQLHALLKTNG